MAPSDPVDAEVRATVEAAGQALEGAGYDVDEVSIPDLDRYDWNARTMPLYNTTATRRYFKRIVGDRWDDLHPAVRRRVSTPASSAGCTLAAAKAAAAALVRDLDAFFERADVLLCETIPISAPAHGVTEIKIDGQGYPPRAALRSTLPFNLSGSPASSVPFGTSRSGLPIGVQLIGRRFGDQDVLQAGAALERARGPLPRPAL